MTNRGKQKPKLIFYTKPNCPLCDEALTALRRAQERLDFGIEEVDILGDVPLYEKYKNDIPVAVVDGREIFRHRADVAALENALKGNQK